MGNKVEEASTVQLQFICSTLKTPIYSHTTISACDGQPVDVAICRDGQVIEIGQLSSLKVEIVALPGDFLPESNSTAEDFDRRIAVSRDGQGSVLEGLCSGALLNGRRSFDGIRFKEGSCRTSTRQFTLAARVVRGQDIAGLIRVHEAFMAPVNVKDRRSEANEKSDRAELNDKVYRLKGVAKNGMYFKRLQEKSIRTVQDFLKAYNRDPERLRDILKINSQRDKRWATMARHALDCDLGDVHKLKKHMIAGGHVVLFFNCVHDLVGAEFHGRYVAKEKFDDSKKAFVDGLKEQAYNELEGIELDYVMKDGRPINISTVINVVGCPPFPIMQNEIQPPHPPDQHATYPAFDNSGPAEINQHMPQTLPNQANCNIAAPDPGAGGSEPFLLDHHRACVNEELAPTCCDPMRAGADREDDPSSSAFNSPDMMAARAWANEIFLGSDYLKLPMFNPPLPHEVFYGNNQLVEASTSSQNNLLSYHPGLDYHPCWETESQAGGIIPFDGMTPYISIQDPPSQTQESELGP